MKPYSYLILAGLCVVLFSARRSQGYDIEIVKSGSEKSTIDLASFMCTGGEHATLFRDTLIRDLNRSGWFEVKGSQGSYALSGTCMQVGERLHVRYEVRNTGTGRREIQGSIEQNRRSAAELAHQVCDEIVAAIKGVVGIARTRIALVGVVEGRRNIYICNYDGTGFMLLTREDSVCMAPTWNPDGRHLYYVSFHEGFPDLYEIDLQQNRRRKIAGFPGMNTGGAVSPDGRNMLLTLSKDGNPDLYVMDLRTERLTRLTKTPRAAEASPSWSPDGREIVFVSDQSGAPQLYVMDARGGRAVRLTVRGSQNVAPDWGPGGDIVYASRREGRFHLCVIDPRTREDRQLTREFVDHEDPSWAPNGRHVVYTRTESFRSDVYILDTMGDPPVRLTTLEGNWFMPAWSPH